jgi:hypothetical protein
MASILSPIKEEIMAAIINIITRGDVNCSNNIFKAEFLSLDIIALGQYNSFLCFASTSEIQFSEVFNSLSKSRNSI